MQVCGYWEYEQLTKLISKKDFAEPPTALLVVDIAMHLLHQAFRQITFCHELK